MLRELHIRRYLREVSRELLGSRKQKKTLLRRVENSVREFASEQPGADYADIVKWFGPPERIAESYVAEMDTREVITGLRFGEKVFHVVAVSALLIVVLWLGVVTMAMKDHKNYADGYYTDEITVIEDRSYEGGKLNEAKD